MRRIMFYLLTMIFVLTTCFQVCEKDDDMYDPDDNIERPSLVVSVNGDISVGNFETGTVGTVTFSRFPVTVNEWKRVREQIGETMMGAVTLQIMAGELYMRDAAAGEECVRLNCIKTEATSFIGHAKDRKGDRPYQFASLLKGSSPANGYNPTKPYTIEFEVRTIGSPITHSTYYEADVYTFFVAMSGRSTEFQYISVLKTPRPDEAGERGKYYIMNSTSNITMQCQQKTFTVDYNGLD